MLLVAGLLARAAAVAREPLAVVPTAAVALLGLAVLGVLAPRRAGSARAAAEQGGPGSARTAARAVTAVVVLTACAGLATGLLVR